MLYRFVTGVCMLSLLLFSAGASTAQDRRVTGRVTSGSDGQPLPGVSVVIKGTTQGANTDSDGRFSLNARNAEDVLVFSFIGYKSQEVAIGNQSAVNLTMVEDVSSLEEVIVTGYTAEKKKDIVGSVSVVNTKSLQNQPTANLQNALQGRAAGVTVSGTGAPGAGAKVRIRGFVSFGNNDPLYVIDGVPTYDPSNLNPQDIASIQVLKDPVSASIYGSRAANGVVVVTTRQGSNRKTEIAYDGYVGTQTIQNSKFPEMLNTQQYGEYLWRSLAGANKDLTHKIYGTGPQPTVPYWLVGNGIGGVAQSDPRANPSLYRVQPNVNPDNAANYQISRTSAGTNWFREIYQPGTIQQHQLSATGGSEKGIYSLGLNYFNQDGNYINTNFKKYTFRANTQFKPRTWLRLGENFQLAYKQFNGNGGRSLDFAGEGSPWAQAYRMVPYIPVYDIQGNFAGNSPGESGNGSSPVANLIRGKDNRALGINLFGNVYAQVDILKDLTASTSFGMETDFFNEYAFTAITYERAENQKNNGFGETFGRAFNWTWTNSLAYRKVFAQKHDVRLFAATEAIKEQFRFLNAFRNDYDFADPNFWSIRTGKATPQVNGAPSTPRTLYSIFGKAEYTYNDRYLFSFTVRRDGSSVFGPENRYATFPSFGVGWRLSEESFVKTLPWITDLKLRGGWGQMGSQRNVDPINSYSFFRANPNNTAYDIAGGTGGVAIGYRPDRVGNPSTKWETAVMTNIGLDGSLFNGRLDFTLEYFNNTTKDLLVDRQRNGLEQSANQPKINVGTMVNKGFDASIQTRGDITTDLKYDIGLTFTSYRNRATKLDAEGSAFFEYGAGRLPGVQRTQAGQPLSSFYGFIIDGIFQNAQEVTSGPTQDGISKTNPQSGVGRWRYRDISGPDGRPDGVINDLDRTFLGVPIPKFQMGTDVVLKYKGFDFNMFLFWNYGNDIYNYTKWWTDLRGFIGGVSTRVLTDSWTPQNTNATLPILNANDTQSGSVSNTYYLEKGSYLRARTVQVGYNLPDALVKRIGLSRARVYLQGQNLFTITKYTGPDPDISILGDSELQMGVDQFRTPAPSVFIGGLGITF